MGKTDEKLKLLREVLKIRLDGWGEDHKEPLQTAESLSAVLESLDRFDEALPLRELGLRSRIELFGEETTKTAEGHLFLGKVQAELYQLIDAERSTWSGLAILLDKAPQSSATASAFNNLASILVKQGRLEEVERLLRQALLIHVQAGDENTLSMAVTQANLAVNLASQYKAGPDRPGVQEKLAEAEKILTTLHKKGDTLNGGTTIQRLRSRLKTLDSLAHVIAARGRMAEAKTLHKKHLAIALREFGDNHPEVAYARRSLGLHYGVSGNTKLAVEELEKALRILRDHFGEFHPDIAYLYYQLGGLALGQPHCEELFQKAIQAVEGVKHLMAISGPDRSQLWNDIPVYHALAIHQAMHGRLVAAWESIELGQSPRFMDDVGLGKRSWTNEERRKDSSLREAYVVALRQLSDAAAHGKPVASWRAVMESAAEEWGKFHRGLQKKYQATSRTVYDLQAIQNQMPPDTALIGWFGMESTPRNPNRPSDMWAYMLRAEGEPVWVRLPESDGNPGWPEKDNWLAAKIYLIMSGNPNVEPDVLIDDIGTLGDWRTPGAKLYRLLFDPLQKHFKATEQLPAVRNLVVLPSPLLSGLPMEVLFAAAPNSPSWTVSYSPSASFYTWNRQRPRVQRSPKLLVVGDPEPSRETKSLPLTRSRLFFGGVTVTEVIRDSNAERSGIKVGDVIVRYNKTEVITPSDLQKAVRDKSEKKNRVTLRREAEVSTLDVEPGFLGVRMRTANTAELAEAARRESATPSYERLPAFGKSAKVVADLVPGSRKLIGANATVANLDRLANDDVIREFTHLYFVGHGLQDRYDPFNSAVVLSNDELYTAAPIRLRWQLDAEVIMLGLCDSGLGRFDPSEGYTGLVQAILLAGGRSVVATRWQVAAQPTGLLAIRLHQNLLGKRPELNGRPMKKAEALREAKEWVRKASDKEIQAHFSGKLDARRSGKIRLRKQPATLENYRHPRFWAGVVLIGNPD